MVSRLAQRWEAGVAGYKFDEAIAIWILFDEAKQALNLPRWVHRFDHRCIEVNGGGLCRSGWCCAVALGEISLHDNS
jgi:hypothetical protein